MNRSPSSCVPAPAHLLSRIGIAAVAFALLAGPSVGAFGGDDPRPVPAAPPGAAPVSPHGDGAAGDPDDPATWIPNYVKLSEHLIRGAQPEGDAAFAALAKAGIKSIVTVDGSRPDVELAKKHGIRYVHIPIGYDGIPADTALELARTFELLAPAGPIFVHCHHGKHRGPAGCEIGRIVLDGISPADAEKELAAAGCDPKYKGLYASVLAFRKPSEAELAKVAAPMPEVAPMPPLTGTMVQIDQTWDRLKLVRMAKWASPADHPDVDPPHEATILAEHFRELARRPDVQARPEEFQKNLKESEAAAWALSTALEKGKTDPAAASAAFDRSVASCTACHKVYRDNAPRVK